MYVRGYIGPAPISSSIPASLRYDESLSCSCRKNIDVLGICLHMRGAKVVYVSARFLHHGS